MTANPDKFQPMILQNSRNSKNYEPIKPEIESAKIETKNTVKLLGITIDNKQILKNIYLNYAKKASMQLNAMSRLQRFMGNKNKKRLLKIFSNFNYCPLVWHFCSCESSQKNEKIQLHCLRII